ncbi:MAG TPA: c-type cytochrome [Caldilineae bacterium]|nr:c-type cytochrome [Caldilineae bacterium]
MDEERKRRYWQRYQLAKQKGVKFYPDIIFKDLVVAFAIFLLLVGLATFVGVPNEPKADPNDTSYIPRPEWYFLFLFQLLKFFPGKLEWIGTTVVPLLGVLALLLLPLYDKNPYRYWKKRKVAVSLMTVVMLGIVGLTIAAVVTTPPQEEQPALAATLAEKIAVGLDLYSVHCVECHGAEGEGGEIKGVEGLEGVVLDPLNHPDFMYTRTDETILNIINYGQPEHGMPPFGLAYGGELTQSEMEAIVTFMRYTWDDRVELPEEAARVGAIPTLGPDEVPSYEVHVGPIVKRYCVSCHRPGKKNNNYYMRTYEEIMTSGDHAPNVIPGDLNSNLILMLHRQEIEAGGPMPPTKALKPELIEIFERWVAAGAPQTAEEAAALSAPKATETVGATETITPTVTAEATEIVTPTGTVEATATMTSTQPAP